MGISSSQEVGVDGFKLRNEVSNELSSLTGERVTISEKTSKQHIKKYHLSLLSGILPSTSYIDVYTINTVHYGKSTSDKKLYTSDIRIRVQGIFDIPKTDVEIGDGIKADLAKINFESGLKQYSGKSDYIFKSETFKVPTLYFCEKCYPPLK